MMSEDESKAKMLFNALKAKLNRSQEELIAEIVKVKTELSKVGTRIDKIEDFIASAIAEPEMEVDEEKPKPKPKPKKKKSIAQRIEDKLNAEKPEKTTPPEEEVVAPEAPEEEPAEETESEEKPQKPKVQDVKTVGESEHKTPSKKKVSLKTSATNILGRMFGAIRFPKNRKVWASLLVGSLLATTVLALTLYGHFTGGDITTVQSLEGAVLYSVNGGVWLPTATVNTTAGDTLFSAFNITQLPEVGLYTFNFTMFHDNGTLIHSRLFDYTISSPILLECEPEGSTYDWSQNMTAPETYHIEVDVLK